ncbi:UNVERIFIED_CONTAM: hypothetical protein RMT77_013226 [Armadillidium vulgare]
MITYWLTGEDIDITRERERRKEEKNIDLEANCLFKHCRRSSLRGSLKGFRENGSVFITPQRDSGFGSHKRLQFIKSDSLKQQYCKKEHSFQSSSRSTSLISVNSPHSFMDEKINSLNMIPSAILSNEPQQNIDLESGQESEIFPLLHRGSFSDHVNRADSGSIPCLNRDKKFSSHVKQSLTSLSLMSPSNLSNITTSKFLFNSSQKTSSGLRTSEDVSNSFKFNKKKQRHHSLNLKNSGGSVTTSHSDTSLSDFFKSNSNQTSNYRERARSIYVESSPLLEPLIKYDKPRERERDSESYV